MRCASASTPRSRRISWLSSPVRTNSRRSLRIAVHRGRLVDVRDDDLSRGIYAADASIYRVPPRAVVLPRDRDEIAGTLEVCRSLGVPVTAVGMLWQHGYFRQSIGPDGRQQALYPVNDTRQMPIEPLHDASGAPLRLAIQLPGLQIWLRGWQARVGLNRLLLLDTNDPANPPIARLIASELYGGDNEMRLRQELVLVIMGGIFVIETLSVMIQVASFKLTGKRVFRMAPIHHHFELKGWPEPRVIVRFWIISVILVLVGLATLKVR